MFRLAPPSSTDFVRFCFVVFVLMTQACGIQPSGSSVAKTPLILASEGTTHYQILIDQKGEPAVSNAAHQLAAYLKKITGVEFPVVHSLEITDKTPAIIVGWGHAAKQFLAEKELSSLGADGILIQTVGPNLVLAGKSPRGTLYAVYEFLETVLGCSWWTASAETIPNQPELEITPQSFRFSPPITVRDPYTKDALASPAFAVKLRRNGKAHDPGLNEEWGGSDEIIGFCHTFDVFLPSADYFPKHPEWGGFRGGQRQPWGQYEGQPCLTNPEFLSAFTEKVIQRLDAHGLPKIISVSQNDNTYSCQCVSCLRVEKEEGSESGPIIRFVNSLAASVAKEYPDVLVETLAYSYSTRPPRKTKPAENVLIRLASYLDNHTAPFEHESNQPFQDRLEGWSKISHQLFIWDYTTDFNDQWKLRPNLLNLAPNIQYFQRNGTMGIFSQGGELFQQCTDFVGLRAWLIGKMLWNPEQDSTLLIRKYLEGFYGAAAPFLEDYIQLVHSTSQKSETLMIGGGVSQLDFPAEFFQQAENLFDSAEEAVKDDPVLLRRVQIERLAPAYLKIVRYPELRDGDGILLFPDSSAAIAACDNFFQQAKQLEVVDQQGYLQGKLALHKIRSLPVDPLEKAGIDVRGREHYDFTAPRLYLHDFGNTTTIEKDQGAACGYAARMGTSGAGWAIQAASTPKMNGRNWTAYARLRYQGEGQATFAIGSYSEEQKLTTATQSVTLSADDGYQVVELRNFPLDPLGFVYFNTVNSDDLKGALFVDRVVIAEP